MESVKEFATRHRISVQRTMEFIKVGSVIAQKKGGVWILLGLQDKPRKGLPQGGRPNNPNKLTQRGLQGDVVKEFDSVKEAAEEMGCIPQNIYQALNNPHKKAMGFYWTRKKEKKSV